MFLYNRAIWQTPLNHKYLNLLASPQAEQPDNSCDAKKGRSSHMYVLATSGNNETNPNCRHSLQLP